MRSFILSCICEMMFLLIQCEGGGGFVYILQGLRLEFRGKFHAIHLGNIFTFWVHGLSGCRNDDVI